MTYNRAPTTNIYCNLLTLDEIIYLTSLILQVVKMLMTMSVLFTLCWMPLHIFFLIMDYTKLFDSVTQRDLTIIYLCVNWLAMSNSFQNPIIYGFLNDNFRVGHVYFISFFLFTFHLSAFCDWSIVWTRHMTILRPELRVETQVTLLARDLEIADGKFIYNHCWSEFQGGQFASSSSSSSSL